MRFGVDASGNYGYKKVGADTVIPFKTSKTHTAYATVSFWVPPTSTAWIHMTITLTIDGVTYTVLPKQQTPLVSHINGAEWSKISNPVSFTDK